MFSAIEPSIFFVGKVVRYVFWMKNWFVWDDFLLERGFKDLGRFLWGFLKSNGEKGRFYGRKSFFD